MEKTSIGNTKTSSFSLVLQKHPLSEPTYHKVGLGVSVSDITKAATHTGEFKPKVFVNGEVRRGNYKPREEDVVNVVTVPGTGLEWYWVAALFIASVAISYALMPDIGDQQKGTGEDETFNRITGLSNESPLYKPYTAILGKRKVAPLYIARPYSTIEGRTEYFHGLFSAGYGPLKLENFRIGETPLADFDDVEIFVLDHYENTDESVIQNFWSQDIFQENVQIELNPDEGWTQRSTQTNPKYVVTTFAFPAGLYRTSKDGDKKSATVKIRQDMQDENGDWWTPIDYFNGLPSHFYTVKGTVTQINGQYRLWTTDEERINPNNASEVSSNSTLLNNEVVETSDGKLLFKNVNESYFVASLRTSGASAKPRFDTLRIPVTSTIWPNNGAINLRVRKSGPTSAEVENDRISAVTQWENIQTVRELSTAGFQEGIGYNRPLTRYDGNSVRTFRPTVIGLRMRATGQLNGNLDNFYVDATMCVPQDKSADWRNWPSLTLEPSNSPADAYKWLLQGPMNYSPIPIEKVNHSNLDTWRTRCVAEDWTISAMLNESSTLFQQLQNVAYVGRAEYSFYEGQFGVVEKIKQTIPRQIFTPKNSANFQSKRVYPEVVDGLKFQFDSAVIDYEQDEAVFLDPAKEADPSKLRGRYTTNKIWGVDNHDQAYRLSRFDYYENKLRRELYTLDVDIESLVSQRGHLVRIQNDIINVGVGAGRIKSIDGNTITLDETINADNIVSGGVQIRSAQGVITTSAATYEGNGDWNCATLDAAVAVGDLVVYGEFGREALDCIIRSISYTEDLTATLTLVNAANEMYDYDGNPIPVYNSNITLPTDLVKPPTPVIAATAVNGNISVVIAPDGLIKRDDYRVYVQVREFPLGLSSEEYFAVDSDYGWSYEVQGDLIQNEFVIVDQARGYQYQVRAQYRSSGGIPSNWSNIDEVELTLGDGIPTITGLTFVHKEDGTYLLYNNVRFPEFDRYEIRTDTNFGDDTTTLEGVTKDNIFFLGLLTSTQTYYVAARNIYGAYGGLDTVTINDPNPADPDSFSAVTEGLGVRLEWSQFITGYPVQKYHIRYTDANVGDDLNTSVALGTVSGLTTVHSLGQQGTYWYYIRAEDIAGNLSGWVSTSVNVVFTADTIRDELDNLEVLIDGVELEESVQDLLKDVSEKLNESFQRREDVNTESLQRIQQWDELNATISGVASATSIRLDEVSADVEGNALAISGVQLQVESLGVDAILTRLDSVEIESEGTATALSVVQGQVNDPVNNSSAMYNLVQQAQLDADNNSTSITAIQNQVDNPTTGLSATNTLAQQAKLSADNSASAVTSLDSRVDNAEGDIASANLTLNSHTTELGELSARAFLGTNVNNRITGVIIDDSGTAQTIQFIADSVEFFDSSNTAKIWFDNQNNRYVFDGHLIAQTGTFSGNVSAASITGGTVSGTAITGSTFTGGQFRTATSGQRLEMGDTDQYVFWYGTGTKNDANAKMWLKNTGDMFVAGEVFQGQLLRERFNSTNTASTTVTGHLSRGNTIKVSGHVNFYYLFQTASQPNTLPTSLSYTLKRGSTTVSSGTLYASRWQVDPGGEPGVNWITRDTISDSVLYYDTNTTDGSTYSYTLSVTDLSGPPNLTYKVSLGTYENLVE